MQAKYCLLYTSTATTALEANVSWTADGQVVNAAGEMAKCDFDGDGDVDTDEDVYKRQRIICICDPETGSSGRWVVSTPL